MRSGADPGARSADERLSRRTDKPICILWQSEWLEGPGPLYENDPHVALFRSSRRCFATLAACSGTTSCAGCRKRPPVEPQTANAAAGKLLAQPTAASLNARRKRFRLHGSSDRRAPGTERRGGDRAARNSAIRGAQGGIAGYRAQDRGGRHPLGLGERCGAPRLWRDHRCRRAVTPRHASTAFSSRRWRRKASSLSSGRGSTAIRGDRRRLGRHSVELLRTVPSPAPIGLRRARFPTPPQGRPLLTGFRGSKPIDLAAIADTVCRVSELIAITRCDPEIDVIRDLRPQGAVAVDALIVRTGIS